MTDVEPTAPARVSLSRRTLADQIAEQLRRDILFGVIGPEDRLTQESVCQRFDTSRIPVRDALQRLMHEGLVEATHDLDPAETLFIVASLLCMGSRTVEWLVAMRALQALGGCVAQVAAMAMVRDFFHVDETAKIISLLILILGASPLLAPERRGRPRFYIVSTRRQR